MARLHDSRHRTHREERLDAIQRNIPEQADAREQTEVCPDCLGSGEIVRLVENRMQHALCEECKGKGWTK